MNYELAKRLKNAGFPQGKGQYAFPNPGPDPVNIASIIYGAYIPILEELIEACGSEQFTLEQQKLGKSFRWRAEDRFLSVVVYGSTPAEAVARLWLALNKKEEDIN